ncbi:MAG: hypothetical protein JWR10_1349 [Rubritepida sp.]|nr:hypothetical protein [Rubritepida sp.]
MMDVLRIPVKVFGRVPTPAVTAPLELTPHADFGAALCDAAPSPVCPAGSSWPTAPT